MVLKFLLSFISKDRQLESLIEKLLYRFQNFQIDLKQFEVAKATYQKKLLTLGQGLKKKKKKNKI